jgi:TRAP-type C4-dicarboxylate transport system substrate-binding protein
VPAVRIRLGGYQPPASVHNRAARLLGEALAARLGDAVRFELDENIVASGHNAADLLDWVGSGRIEMCYFSASYLANEAPQLAALDAPFIIERREQAYALLDGALGEQASAQLARTRGYQVLGYFDNGFRHITNRLRPLRQPQDCKGLRIRTLASEAHARVFRRLGFEPVALDVKDLVPALQAGTVDAQDNPLTNTYNFGVHRYHRHLTLSAHFWGAAVLLCHGESYAHWPAEVQSAVAAAAGEAIAAQRRLAAAEDDEVLARLEAAGCDIVRLSPEERALWKEAST